MAVRDGLRVEEGEVLSESENVVQRFRQRGEVQGRSLGGGISERELLTEDGLTASRHADDQVDRVLKEPSVEDLIEPLVAAWQPVAHGSACSELVRRTRALVPRRSLIVDTSSKGSMGLRKKAPAPTLIASPTLSMEATATICEVPVAANSFTSRNPAPPEINRSMSTRSGDLSSKCSLAWVASRAMTTS